MIILIALFLIVHLFVCCAVTNTEDTKTYCMAHYTSYRQLARQRVH